MQAGVHSKYLIEHDGYQKWSENCLHFQSITLVFNEVCCSILRFLCSVLQSIVCPFVLLLLAIASSVFHRLMASNYPFWYIRTCLDSLLFAYITYITHLLTIGFSVIRRICIKLLLGDLKGCKYLLAYSFIYFA